MWVLGLVRGMSSGNRGALFELSLVRRTLLDQVLTVPWMATVYPEMVPRLSLKVPSSSMYLTLHFLSITQVILCPQMEDSVYLMRVKQMSLLIPRVQVWLLKSHSPYLVAF